MQVGSTTQRLAAMSGGLRHAATQAAMLAVTAVVAAITVAGLVAATGVELVVTATLAMLAVAGLFFLFGLMAGYVQLDASAGRVAIERSLSRSADTALEIVTLDGSPVYSNPACGRLVRDALSIESLLSAGGSAADVAYRLSAAAERGENRIEDVYLAAPAGGTGRWLRVGVRSFSAPATLSDGRPMALWHADDITSDRRRQAESTAEIAHALAFYETMPVGIVALSRDGSVRQMNGAMRKLIAGAKPASTDIARAQTHTIGDLFSTDSAVRLTAALSSREAGHRRFDLDVFSDAGAMLAVQGILSPANDAGERTLVVIEASDADAGSTATVAVDPDRFARLFNAAPFGLATLDINGVPVNTNATFLRLFPGVGTSGSMNLATHLVSLAGAEQKAELSIALERAMSGRAGAAPIEIALSNDPQAARRLYINPLTVGLDPREVAVVYVADASEQKALEQKFAQAHKMEAVGKLAGGIAHDFNNVLTVIMGLSDMLLQSRRPTDPGYNDIMQIRSNAQRVASMVQQLLAFSRKQTLEPEVLAVNEVVHEYVHGLRTLVGERVSIDVQSGRDLWYVKADKTQFYQVLFNLIGNARDAMPGGGKVTIRTRNVAERESLKHSGRGMQAGEYVLVEVQDSGTGMTQEIMDKIFEPFFTTKDVGKGTGMGLSTVYGIIKHKQTNGFIYPESEVGKGTTFRVFLPRYIPGAAEEAEAAAQQKKKEKEQSRDLTGTGRVLLVEDEDGVRSFAVRALQRQGYEVLEATSGAEALDVIAEAVGGVDVVVSDVIMPEMDGPSMYKEMLKTRPDLKIIFVSGYPRDAFEKSLGPDADFAFLAKPFTLPELASKVKEVLAA